MFHLQSSLVALVAGCLLMTVVWALHLRDEDASIVDPVWGAAITAIGVVYALDLGVPFTGGRLLVLLLALAWSLRLGLHLGKRHELQGEDRRYKKMREKRGDAWWWQSFYVVFMLQAGLAWLVALALMGSLTGPASLGWLGWAGWLVGLFGFAFEAVADGQLAHYLRRERGGSHGDEQDSGERGVMDQGLWRYSRHPNYFGESVIWWGIGLIAVAHGAYWALVGPAVITFMLLKVSGVALTEEDIADRRPAYRDYVRRTNSFFPWPPSKSPEEKAGQEANSN